MKSLSRDSSQKWVNLKENAVDSSHLFAETQGPQERFHIIKLSVAEALQPLWVTGLAGQTHCTDLVDRREREVEKWHYITDINKIEKQTGVKMGEEKEEVFAFGINMS